MGESLFISLLWHLDGDIDSGARSYVLSLVASAAPHCHGTAIRCALSAGTSMGDLPKPPKLRIGLAPFNPSGLIATAFINFDLQFYPFTSIQH